MGDIDTTREIVWLGSTQKDLADMPLPVKEVFANALYQAQKGETHPDAKMLKGQSGIYEVVEDYNSDTYREVYTVKYEEAVYVLHIFQKKSKSGIKTPQKDLKLIESRAKWAKQLHEQYLKEKKSK